MRIRELLSLMIFSGLIMAAEAVKNKEVAIGMEKAYAKKPNQEACKDCCPRPKATVTVTETGYLTVTCTHTRSVDRTQSTTVRFTSTSSSITTRTELVNFTETTTYVTSRQITTFSTENLVKFRVFTRTETVFTSFAIATVFRTTQSEATTFISTLSFSTLTNVSVLSVTIPVIVSLTLTSIQLLEQATQEVVRELTTVLATATDARIFAAITTLPNTLQIIFPNTQTGTSFTTVAQVFDKSTVFTDTVATNIVAERITELPGTATVYTNPTFEVYKDVTTILTFSRLY